MYRLQKGFTLIELMIAVAIMAILTAIALPAYSQYIVKSRRSDAKVSLLTIAQLQETYFADNNQYAIDDPFKKLNAENEGFEKEGSTYYSKEGYYKLTFSDLAETYFAVKATPTGMQLEGEKDLNYYCHTFIFDSLGQKTVEATKPSGNDDCWD